MTIAEARGKCKTFLERIPRDVLIVSILVLASTLSFGLGYLAGQEAGRGSEITIEPSPLADSAESLASPAAGKVVASKSGTKYYLPSCPGVDRISEENKVWFVSASAARAQGYTPAANCNGL